jgi:ribonuclease HI
MWCAESSVAPQRKQGLSPLSNTQHIHSAIPDHYIMSHIRMIHNATPTERRRAGSRLPIQTRGPNGDNPCFLCGATDDSAHHIDSLEHLLADCLVAHRARTLFHASLSIPAPQPLISHSLLLTCFQNKKFINATISFNFSLYSHSRIYFATRCSPPPHEVGARRIARVAISDWAVWAPKRWSPNPGLLTNTLPRAYTALGSHNPSLLPDYTKRNQSRFGNASSRNPKQKKAAIDYAQHLLSSIPPTSLIAFTDGSANPNPGPCGAGAYVFANNDQWRSEASAALGHGSNNTGELFAIAMAVQLAIPALRNNPSLTHLYILSDSQLTLDLVLRKSKPRTAAGRNLLTAVHAVIDTLPSHTTLQLRWVPAHVGLGPNEHADYLAGLGSAASASGQTNINRLNAIQTGIFLPAPD